MMSQKMSQQDDAEMVKLKNMMLILVMVSVIIMIVMMVTIRNQLDMIMARFV